jgi:hypothetical protein
MSPELSEAAAFPGYNQAVWISHREISRLP